MCQSDFMFQDDQYVSVYTHARISLLVIIIFHYCVLDCTVSILPGYCVGKGLELSTVYGNVSLVV